MSKSQTAPYSVRFPEDMKQYLAEQAEKNHRSFHSEILYRIGRTIEQDKSSSGLLNNEHSPELVNQLNAILHEQADLRKLLTNPDFAARFVKDGLAGLAK